MRASEAAAALDQGSLERSRALLADWRFAHHEELLTVALNVIRAARPTPPSPDATRPPMDATAWALYAASGWGRWLRQTERRWERPVRLAPTLDAAAKAAWVSLFNGQPFGAFTYVQKQLLPAALRIFQSVMQAEALPTFEIKRVQNDLSEGFFSLLLADQGGVPVWLDLGVRTLERSASGPVMAIATYAQTWDAAAHCLSQKRSWNDTICALCPELSSPITRAERLLARLASVGFGVVLDLHLLCRLCRSWSEGGTAATRPAHGRALLRRNIDRVRARLRAMLADDRASLLTPLLNMDGLHDATLAATRRLAWALARRELETGFSMSFARASLQRCLAPRAEPLPPTERAPLLTWVLLVVLRGRLAHLRRWLEQGTTGDHDAVWGRLLSSAPLCAPGERRHQRLRKVLREHFPDMFAAHRPVLRQLALLPPGRHLRQRCERLLRPSWSATIPFPERDFPAIVRHASAALHLLSEGEA